MASQWPWERMALGVWAKGGLQHSLVTPCKAFASSVSMKSLRACTMTCLERWVSTFGRQEDLQRLSQNMHFCIFVCNHCCCLFWSGEQENAYLWRTSVYLAASASAEFFADIALAPMEACKVRIQTQPGYANTLRECAPKMHAEEGLNAWVDGVTLTILRGLKRPNKIYFVNEMNANQ